MKKLILSSFFLLAGGLLFANSFKCTIKNIHQPANTNNVLEFDVYLQNTSAEEMKFQAFQAGINFNYEQLANGGTITGEYVKGTCDKSFTGIQTKPNWNVNSTSRQIRLLAAIQPSKDAATKITQEGLKLGTFRLQNTKPFATATPNFTWEFSTGSNITRTTVTAFEGAKRNGESLTTQKSFSYENQGPEYFVESNPVINAKPSSVSNAVSANAIQVYPNPVVDVVKVDYTSSKSEVLTLKLIDNTGRVVKQITEDVVSGSNTLTMDVQELATGTYSLQLSGANAEIITKQIVKQ